MYENFEQRANTTATVNGLGGGDDGGVINISGMLASVTPSMLPDARTPHSVSFVMLFLIL